MNPDKMFISSAQTWIDYFCNSSKRLNPYVKQIEKQTGGGLIKGNNGSFEEPKKE